MNLVNLSSYSILGFSKSIEDQPRFNYRCRVVRSVHYALGDPPDLSYNRLLD